MWSEPRPNSRLFWGAEVSFDLQRGPRGASPTWNGKQLLSAYDPGREAKAWAEGLAVPPGSLVFVAGDPLGFASLALANLGVKAVPLLPGREARSWLPEGLVGWAPEDGPLETFLSDVFETTGPDAVVWQVWPAFERLAPETALDWGRRFRDHYRTVQGSWLTNRRFGPRFWTNALRNTVECDRPARFTPGDRPLVIAASGPSLDDGLAVLAGHRDRFDLWALPSSFETLVRRGLVPDAGVATDGGFYAREHLQRLAGTPVPVLAALSSAPDPVLCGRPCLFFSQGLPVERALLEAGGAYAEVPSQGTVAVTALRLALEATTGPVFIAGLDLAFRDLRGHTSPHTVDRRLEAEQGRLRPAEALWAERLFDQATVVQSGVRTSAALLTYALWFRSRARFSRPVFRIAPSAVRWDTMVEVGWDAAAELWKSAPGHQPVVWNDAPAAPRSERSRRAAMALKALRARAQSAADDDPWLVETCRTAVPEALGEEFKLRRLGRPGGMARKALEAFLTSLAEERL